MEPFDVGKMSLKPGGQGKRPGPRKTKPGGPRISRRDFIIGTAAALAAGAIGVNYGVNAIQKGRIDGELESLREKLLGGKMPESFEERNRFFNLIHQLHSGWGNGKQVKSAFSSANGEAITHVAGLFPAGKLTMEQLSLLARLSTEKYGTSVARVVRTIEQTGLGNAGYIKPGTEPNPHNRERLEHAITIIEDLEREAEKNPEIKEIDKKISFPDRAHFIIDPFEARRLGKKENLIGLDLKFMRAFLDAYFTKTY